MKYTITNLTDLSVSILIEEYEGDLLKNKYRIAFSNSVRGRERVQSDIPSPYRDAIIMVWGETPKVDEDIEPE